MLGAPNLRISVLRRLKATIAMCLISSFRIHGHELQVRIPAPPPLALAKAFSRSGGGRIFSLFSRVMRVRLITGPCAKRPGSGLPGPIFSEPDDFVGLVNSLYLLVIYAVSGAQTSTFRSRSRQGGGTENQYPEPTSAHSAELKRMALEQLEARDRRP